MFKLFIFDLDMTLINSLQAMKKVYSEICKLIGKKHSQKEFIEFVGRSVTENAEYFHKLNPKIPKQKIRQTAIQTFLKSVNTIKPYKPNIIQQLNKRGIKTAIITNNALTLARNICKKFNIKADAVLADEQLKARGKAWAIKQLIKRFKLKPEEVLYIGDHKNDIAAAREAKVKSAIIRRKTTKLGKLKPDYYLNSLRALTKFFNVSSK
ncbi:hypothetical protein DRJ19_01490 [Candidatus Woesearchaeota archaeon]|nr:MAG: hypothetical protein DRJ19_01490 [Candidatus Woesearchaeota archaeon]